MKQQNVDSEIGEVVPWEDIARGYEIGKAQYLIVEDEEFEAVQVERGPLPANVSTAPSSAPRKFFAWAHSLAHAAN